MSEKKKAISFRKTLDMMIRGVRHILLHNGMLKLVAVLISVVLWAGLISQDESVTRDKTFQNVNVSVTGSESMKNNGFIVVSDLDELLNGVSIVAAVPQKLYESAEASNYNVRLDLSKIQNTGEQELKLQKTDSATYGKVTSINPSSVMVEVEDYIVRQRIPVSVSVEGEPPTGWYMKTSDADPTLVSVSGPRSLVQTIVKASAVINTEDIEWTEGTFTNSYEITLLNRAGEEVDSSLLSMTSSSLTIDSVLIDLNILPSEYFPTDDLIQVTGHVAEGYQISHIKISPEIITVSARQEVLDQLTDLSLDRSTVNVDNLTETTVFQLKVLKPSDSAVLSNETITVTVEVEPESESETEPEET